MLKIAWRNILRNKRRSFLIFSIIIFGVMVLFLVEGYFSAAYEGLKMMSISMNGHLQIAKKGFWDNTAGERAIVSGQEYSKIVSVLAGDEDIKDYTPQLKVSGILGTEKSSTIVSGVGVEPGHSFYDESIMIKEGTNLFAGDKDRVLLGQGVMEKLNLEVDEWVSIMATTLDGAYNANSLRVSGSFTTYNAEADSFYIRMPLSFAQGLLNTDGVDNIIVILKENDRTDEVIERLRNRFNEMGLDLEIKSWLDLATMYQQVKSMFDMIFFFLSLIIFILVFFSILEIMSMAFFERIREIGTIRAIGTRRRQVFLLLLEEALILGIVGGIIGIGLGWGIGAFLNNANVTYTPPSVAEPVPLYFTLELANGTTPFLIVLVSTALSAVYPALRASRINVVEMLRYS